MKLIIILIVGILIGTWLGLRLASFVVVSAREEEQERNYWKGKYYDQNTEAQDPEGHDEA